MSAGKIAEALLPQGPQANQSASTRQSLSCTSCRERKIKCDKSDPCDPCVKSGIRCSFPTRRVRAPRGRRHDLEQRDAELLRRIKRLEGLLANKVDTGPAGLDSDRPGRGNNKSPTPVPPLISSVSGESNGSDVTVDEQFASFVQQQGSSSRHLDRRFWSSLGDEFDGLRQLIEGPLDDEDDLDDLTTPTIEATHSSQCFILQDSNSFVISEAMYPSHAHSALLFRFYFTNVDPICKILHRPTVDFLFTDLEALLDPFSRRFKFPSLEAVTFAAYFAAVLSMSPQECLTYLGEDKDILSARYKRITEAALVQADFLNSLEITALQALTIYIVAQRSLNQGRSSWALIGLAVRIARGIGLHRDGHGRAFSPFEAEMRRRMWWQILALDIRASEDRGSETILAENFFDTEFPCNLNDEDIGYESPDAFHSKTGPTDMTLCLLGMDALCTGRKISFTSPTGDANLLTLQEREELVQKYAERIESTYLASCGISDPRTWLLRTMGHYWIYKLRLNLYYPLQHRMPSQQAQSRTHGLQTAVTFLNFSESIEQHPSFACFAWLLKTYAPWHAVAVTLAELCTHPQGPLADRAWEIIESRFKDWTSRIADAKETMLWGPIKNLLKRARAARQYGQESSHAKQALQPSELDSIIPSFNEAGTAGPGFGGDICDNSFDPQSFDDFGLIDQPMDHSLDFLSLPLPETTATDPELPSAFNDLDNWNDFMFDVNALSGEPFPESYATWPPTTTDPDAG